MWKGILTGFFLAVILLAGCGDDETTVVEPGDLAPPLGLQSITGNAKVTLIWWCSNFNDDLEGYKVYFAEGEYEGGPMESLPSAFSVADSMTATAPCNRQVQMDITGLTNGTTYSFFVVAAKDDWTDVSHTSNVVEDTPRPESAAEVTLYAKQIDATQAGYELSDFSVVDCTDIDDNYTLSSELGDLMCERFNPGAGARAWLDGINGAFVQDIGFMSDWQDADEAPTQGYSGAGHSIEALRGHVYAVWTSNDHFAKVQITAIDDEGPAMYEWIRITGAYQTQESNPDYQP